MSVRKTIAGIACWLTIGSAMSGTATAAFAVGGDVSGNLLGVRSFQPGTAFSGLRTGVGNASIGTGTIAFSQAPLANGFRVDERILFANAGAMRDVQRSLIPLAMPAAAEGQALFEYGANTPLLPPIDYGFASYGVTGRSSGHSANTLVLQPSYGAQSRSSLESPASLADDGRTANVSGDDGFRFAGIAFPKPGAWVMLLSAVSLCGLIVRRRLYF